MTRGRKPKPSHLKAVQGNAGKRAINHDEPEGDALDEVPPAPDWLCEIGRDAWDKLAPWLVGSKILTRSDLHQLEAYCDAYATWRQAVVEIQQCGLVLESPATGAPIKNPALTAKNEAARQMTTFGSALGLDPSSRARLAVPGSKDAANPFAELLGGNKR
ncbi:MULTISPECIES: phage terminase small subunit P27 family [Cobetia]|uniref:Phage terminase small subunit P27 family n=1 Tax=Cobetia amphilecti TaxID=1055104 RepID=A0AAP4TXD7_9GAMM|nr:MULTISPECIES: phage terminase small subunit P27 family [Cobetia]MBR9756416.1 phage terminase small subunit P27 family [Gammaproteobacteria bacterium]MDO6671232.1 phage terminase small subunit P27 family [Cobetia amphilecti]QWN37879.1 phage terminase small subunit P27 family [Cobetia sp. 4B]WOI27103.1 phage terminase small subunit P27 family [Cobetia amphilecti]